MNTARRHSTQETGSTNILPFPSLAKRSTGSSDDIGRLLLDREVNDDQVKTWIESAVMQAYLSTKTEMLGEHDGPFDPIYIAALRPDSVDSLAITALQRFETIEDKSMEIFFDDGLDD
jgi:hypothetical protein